MADGKKVFDISIKSILSLLVTIGLFLVNDIKTEQRSQRVIAEGQIEAMRERVRELEKGLAKMEMRWQLMAIVPPNPREGLTLESMQDVTNLITILKENGGP